MKTIIVFVIALLFGAYIFFYERKAPTTEEREEKAKKVFDFESENVGRLGLTRGHRRIVCEKEKEEEKWLMLEPLKVKADKAEIDGILSSLEFLRIERKLKEEKDKKIELKDFGLDEPRIKVTFDVDEESTALLVGDDCAVGDNMYAMREGRKDILVIRKSVFDTLNKDVDDLRDRQVLEVEKHKVAKLLIERKDGVFECRKGNGKWRITNPIQDRGDAEKIEEILDKLDELKVEDFVSEDPAEAKECGLLSPQLAVTVWRGDSSSSSVVFGNEKGKDKVYAKRKAFDSIYSVQKNIIESLTKEPSELRDKKVVRFEPDKVNRIELAAFDGKTLKEIVIERENEDDWKLVKPVEAEADRDEVEDFLDDIKDLEIEKFVEEKPDKLEKYGLEKPQASATLVLKEPDEKHEVLFGKKTGSDCYLKREGEKPVFTVPVDFLKKVRRGYLTYKDRDILEFTQSDVKKLVVERSGKKYVCQRDEDDEWEFVEPAGSEIDSSAVDDILWDLSSLRTENFVVESSEKLSKYGLDKPRITVNIEIEEGEEKKKEKKEYTLLIGKKTKEDNFYSLLKGKEEVFEVSNSVVENLKKDLEKKEEAEQTDSTDSEDKTP